MTPHEIAIFRLIQIGHFLLAYIETWERGEDNPERAALLGRVSAELDEIEESTRQEAK